ncbi:MAG: hypothetical protein CM15mP120_30570 [Pseudomonadota bacterium]|nr:MAG: hypothetical protein CM15mP120_30570 [Pseudomonadota bacterium]
MPKCLAQMVDPVVDYLAAAGGVLHWNLAIGTGAHCSSLAQRGVAVTGIDLSPHMLEHGTKPGSERSRRSLAILQQLQS